MKSNLFIKGISLVFCLFFVTGCMTFSQTSKAISDTGASYSFAVPALAEAAYRKVGSEELILKCPVLRFRLRHSLVKQVLPPSYTGGYRYERESNLTNEYAFVKARKNKRMDSYVHISDMELYENPDLSFLTEENEILVPDYIRKLTDESFPITIPGTRPGLVFVRKEGNSLNVLWKSLAVVDAVIIDVPLSVIMTLSGSIWYVSLSDVYL